MMLDLGVRINFIPASKKEQGDLSVNWNAFEFTRSEKCQSFYNIFTIICSREWKMIMILKYLARQAYLSKLNKTRECLVAKTLSFIKRKMNCA